VDDIPESGKALLESNILPISPGHYFSRYVMAHLGRTREQTVQALVMSEADFAKFLNDETEVDCVLAAHLAAYADTTSDFWLNMQTSWTRAKQTLPPEECADYVAV
jgi:plasmid maintenance system antidote protein VapI